MTKTRLYYILIFLLFVVFIGFETLKPRPIDWSYNYTANGKMPYGCYAIKNLLSQYSKGKTMSTNFDNFYIWKNSYYLHTGNALVIITNSLELDSLEFNVLCKHVSAGNAVFIASEGLSTNIRDSLKISIEDTFSKKIKNDKHIIAFNIAEINDNKRYVFEANNYSWFSGYDSSRIAILASDAARHAVFIKLPLGNGAFYLSTTPLYFTNYALLYNNSDYSIKCLSFVANKNIIWDEYYKPNGSSRITSSSPLRYILSKPNLATAYYILLFSALVFLFLEGRRRQRAIPVYGRPVNQSLDFTRTVAMLYFNQKKFKNLADKRMVYFNDFVFSKYKVRFDETDPKSIQQLSEKSNVPETLINRIFNTQVWLKQQKEISEFEALNFIEMTNRFIQLSEEKETFENK